MIGRTDLDRGFSTRRDSSEPYAEFRPDGSLASMSFSSGGRTITLYLEPGGAGSRVERSKTVTFEEDEDTEGGADPLDEWARHWIGEIYDRAEDVRRCSFCQKSDAEVDKLVAGPEDVYICDECVRVCHTIVEEE